MLTKNRIETLDVLRGVALLGILVMNVPGFSVPRLYTDTMVRYEGAHTLNYYTWVFDYVFLNGKMRFLFSMLFGAGIILFTSKKETDNLKVADAYFRRMLWLLVFALFTTYILLASTGILYEYALCGMLLFVFRNTRVRWLLVMAAICFTIYSVKSGMGFLDTKEKREVCNEAKKLVAQGKPITKEQQAAIDFWKNGRLPERSKLKNKYSADVKLVNSGYFAIFEENANVFNEVFSSGFYSTFWETFGSIALGMGLFKLGVLSGDLRRKTYLLMASLGLGAGLPFTYYLSQVLVKGQLDTTGEYFDTRWFSVFHMEQIPRVLCALGYIGLILWIYQMGWFKKVMHLFASLGRMAFTNYLMQNILCVIFFFGFGMFAKIEYYQLHYVVLVIWVIQLIFSLTWLHFYKMGPFEWIWRRLTYGKKFTPPA
ncbi:MAG TPA: DUF418 domain-containing protein [Bacteroidia bacterium]|jgi:uncharacterized protein|nr:DUF418 domain-containing protein [Bacteroidia bacterium]